MGELFVRGHPGIDHRHLHPAAGSVRAQLFAVDAEIVQGRWSGWGSGGIGKRGHCALHVGRGGVGKLRRPIGFCGFVGTDRHGGRRREEYRKQAGNKGYLQ